MRLDSVLTQAASGLQSVSQRLAVVGQNVANADTKGYSRESVSVSSLQAGGEGMGVRTGVVTRASDAALQAELFAADGQVAGQSARSTALAAIDGAAGVPGDGQDLASLVGRLRDAFSTLAGDPANQTLQREVVNQAGALARGVNGVGEAIVTARQSAQDRLVDDVASANAGLKEIGALSDQIILAASRGEGTADLEDKRDVAMRSVSTLTGARFLKQANGDVVAFSGGTVLPTRSGTGPLSLAPATLAAGTTGPPLLVSGAAARLGFGSDGGGQIGAELDLRDTVLPPLQSGIDGFAQGLAAGFAAAGLTLVTDAGGSVPTTAAGFSQTIQVAAAVSATPTMVRDGAAAPAAAGDTTLITALLSGVLKGGVGSLSAQATTLAATHAGLAATAARRLEVETGVQASVQSKLEAKTAVTVDTEMADMVRLQNSYGANAKVLSTVQTIFQQLMDAKR